MIAYQVKRQEIKYKGKVYRSGDYLPIEFTERDKYRNIYPSRIARVEVTLEQYNKLFDAPLEKNETPSRQPDMSSETDSLTVKEEDQVTPDEELSSASKSASKSGTTKGSNKAGALPPPGTKITGSK